ncbi:YqhR family membrane protein [Paenibacillus macerans]|uniref:YqhR family membrane protein n=1 Tax=Paenibacillus macerans TaxID=44252 RepID=UPI003D32006B
MKQKARRSNVFAQPWRQQRREHTNIWLFSLEIGLFAGLIWGGVKGLFYYMRFTTILPGYLVEPFFKNSFLHSRFGYYVGWLSFIVFSILATMLYTVVFRKLKGPGPGILYGMVWWFLIFAVLGPLFQMTRPLPELRPITVISEFCLYLLWGLFIGYTAAEEYTDERQREPKKTPNNALQ